MRFKLRDKETGAMFLNISSKEAKVDSRDNFLDGNHLFNVAVATVLSIALLFHANSMKKPFAVNTLEGIFVFSDNGTLVDA